MTTCERLVWKREKEIEVRARERNDLIDAAYEELDEEARLRVDYVAEQLEVGIKNRDGYSSYTLGPKSARELTWALCRLVHETLAGQRDK